MSAFRSSSAIPSVSYSLSLNHPIRGESACSEKNARAVGSGCSASRFGSSTQSLPAQGQREEPSRVPTPAMKGDVVSCYPSAGPLSSRA